MTNNTENSSSNPSDIIKDLAEDKFLELAGHLRDMQDSMPEYFVSIAQELGIARRKAYALAAIDRAFRDLKVNEDRLRAIGWTKAMILSPYVNADNVAVLIRLAETNTAHDLQLLLRGMDFDPEGRTVVLHLTKVQYGVFTQAMQRFGADIRDDCVLGRETAITHALEKALRHSDRA